MKKPNMLLSNSIIMFSATLVVAAITIVYLYFGIQKVVDSGSIDRVFLDDINELFLLAIGIAIVAAFFVIASARYFNFRLNKPMTQKIERQAEIFHTMVQTAHEAVFLIDVKGIIQFANPYAEKLFGYEEEELLNKNIKQLMPSPHREKHDSYITNYLKTGIKQVIGSGRQLIGQRKDGSQFPLYLSVGEIELNHTHLFAGLIMDLSTQQKLQREILAIPAREQQRIGVELHDGLGQQLTGLSMLAQSLLNKATKSEYDLASQIASGLHEALTQVKALSRGLMPVQIHADGFMVSLREITEIIERQSNIPIKLQIDDVVLLFDDATATHLYRIVQESLNNAVKHSGADLIEVILKLEDDHGILQIIDNGIGIATNLEDSTGLGLNIMKHRCGLFDGEISINPGGHRGTKVTCRFPLKSEDIINDKNLDRR